MSRSESFGIVLCEAWLFGKPVIANRVCYSFRELVRDGETGFLVTTDTELTEAMKSLASDVEARGRMGRAGFQDVVTKFTWERVAEACFGAFAPVAIAKNASAHMNKTTPGFIVQTAAP
jgi:glycosyltransferase involved in cell wall biosynthesis